MPKLFETPSDLAGYLFRITDNGGATADRYTVVFSDGGYLGLSGAPSHPQGVSMWGDRVDPAYQQQSVEEGTEIDLALGDLPEGMVNHILGRCNEAYADFLEIVEKNRTSEVATTRDGASINEGTCDSVGKGLYLTEEGYRVRLNGSEADDRGPYKTAREAVLATLPDHYDLAGPEYHSTVDDLMRMEPDAAVAEAVAALEAKVANEERPSSSMMP